MASTIVIIIVAALLVVSIMFNIYLIAKNALIREYVQSYDESIKKLEDKLRVLIQKSKGTSNEP
jgi:uncharacterized membrane protein YgaE (UPF0421/DUF939 family)